jgi:signal transduction histidine kinase
MVWRKQSKSLSDKNSTMTQSSLTPPATAIPEIPPRWRKLLRVVGSGFLLLLVGLFIISLPTRYRELTQICTEEPWLTPNTISALAEWGLSVTFYATFQTAIEVMAVGLCAILCLFIFYAHSHTWMGLLTAVVVLASPIFILNSVWTFIQVNQQYALLVEIVQDVTVIALFGFMHLFPNGRFVPRWSYWNLLLFAIWQFVTFVHIGNPLERYSRTLYGIGFFLVGILGCVMVGVMIYRYRRILTHEQKQQVKWVILAIIVNFFGAINWILFFEFFQPIGGQAQLLNNTLNYPFAMATQVAIPIAITIASLNHRLWDVDIILNRTLLYSALTVIVVALYVAMVTGASRLLHSENNLVPSLAATGVIAVFFHPMRTRLETIINRWLFGDRDDPAGVLTRLTSHLEAADSGTLLLENLVETIASSLKLPYVALRLRKADGALGGATESGRRPTVVEVLPLMHQQKLIGQLEVAPRSPGEALSPADQQLLATIARLAATSARTLQLSNEVQEARMRIVSAREEERRRLRRDLHDGFGPALAAIAAQAEAARDLISTRPEISTTLLNDIVSQSQNATSDIRRLVYALRPPALDELGLVGAIQAQAQKLNQPDGLQVTVQAETLPPLSAAVEVAAYRIVHEALTNVVRHAQAKHCTVSISVVEDRLQLAISDDGIGMSNKVDAGVGLRSMRERAEELGGSVEFKFQTNVGVALSAHLPLNPTPPFQASRTQAQ